MPLDPAIRIQLLRHARTAITNYLTGRNDAHAPWPADLPRSGAFVTLHNHDQLRGCIGVFVTDDDLPDTIARMAVAAARDPRFRDNPLTTAELKDIHIDISLLSPLAHITNPLDFDLGRHGIYVKQGRHIGCFLPDVATEAGWSKETFLAECCAHKAGLGANAWNAPDTEVYRFTVEKVSE
jgi:uncharacterized protein